MGNITIAGIDLAKSVFQFQGNDDKGHCLKRRQLSRADLPEFIAQLHPCTIVMEACSGAHFFARKFSDFGHTVKLIAPQFVKPFVRGNKNDPADAAAICEAAVRPSMHFVPVKTVWHQDVQAIHRVRERLVGSRTALANEMRGLLAEYGVVTVQGVEPLRRLVTSLVAENDEALSPMGRETMADLLEELASLEERIAISDRRLDDIAKNNDACQRLMKIRGIGVISATAIVAATPDPSTFKNGRQFAAWLGLVPRHSGTGGKNRLGGISKRGDRYLRCLLVHGARSVVCRCKGQDDKLSKWVQDLRDRRGYNKAAVALANKNARIVWAVLAKKEDYKRAA